ncbi:desulfoferrodoxin [Candidatus Berkelbacteria bacterium RIFOXYA2_FULL_43_10]|uniref:Desulfoferrodoxin n=1 Tax=Candidatus Berkelbacteria bacterium RIFOXYA2_FULL_43_10 TaxID=1797472 RepID=A0A1F5E4S7_9BACT|nr:MAG: desulfoferrodoxin [Candidatus Berkelbacteria bacterium RIFOXYA2_FULL_43_10]
MANTKKRGEIYKCNVCGNIVEVLFVGGGELVCCGQPMENQHEKTEDEGVGKHKPVLTKSEKGIEIKIGSVPHPMEENHYIEWIEALSSNNTCKRFLKPGDSPTAEFESADSARAYCNVHGLWKSE